MKLPAFTTLICDTVQPDILQITLNRQMRLNAIDSHMMQEWRTLWQNLNVDHQSLRCIIITGCGRAFCAGADLKERSSFDLTTWQQHKTIFEQAMIQMMDCPIPIIAAVNGAAFGGGLEILLACDFAYAADTALFSQSEVKVGLIPGALGTQNLPRAVGVRRAKELIFTGKTFNAKEALEWGVINRIVAANDLLATTLECAKQITLNAPLAVRQAKKSINMSQQVDIKSGFAFELEAYQKVLLSQDREEGIKAFNEKRTPTFSGK